MTVDRHYGSGHEDYKAEIAKLEQIEARIRERLRSRSAQRGPHAATATPTADAMKAAALAQDDSQH